MSDKIERLKDFEYKVERSDMNDLDKDLLYEQIRTEIKRISAPIVKREPEPESLVKAREAYCRTVNSHKASSHDVEHASEVYIRELEAHYCKEAKDE